MLIETILEDGAAAEAGLRGTIVDRAGYIRRLGDVVVKIGELEVREVNDLKDALERHKAGDRVRVTFLRDDRVLETTVQLQLLR
ncbi:MAG: PDZ domain-containing protein [Planctomycetota bacterium]